MQIKSIIASAVLTIIGSALPASAALTAYEPFGYSSSIDNTTPAGGAGFTGTWAKSVGGSNSIVTGLTESPLPTSGNAVKAAGGNRALQTLSSPVSSGVVYFSGLIQLNGDPGGVKNGFVLNGSTGALFVGNTAGFNGTSNFLGVGPIGNGINFDNPGPGFSNASSASLNADDHVLVVRLDLGTGAVNLYVDPATGPSATEPGVASATTTVSIGTLLSLGFQGDGVQPTLDEMRLGTTYLDVVNSSEVSGGPAVPEPASLGLLGLGALSLLARRRANA